MVKFFAPLVMGAIALLSSEANANGVCYDPNHGTGMDANSVAADMKIIAGLGFDSVRTYISMFGDVEIGPIVVAAGLKVMLGVPYPQSDYQDQMAAAIKAAQAGGVSAIMLGNENLAGVNTVPSDMVSVLQSIKSQVPSGVLVGTVQRNTEVIGHSGISGWDDLVSQCDLVGVNAQPFFNPNTACEDGINVLKSQWDSMSGTYGSKLVLTETGWPSNGTLSGNTGSPECAETFYNAYQEWSSSISEKFYFQIFDTPYRTEEYEKTFGVTTFDGQNKFSMTVQQISTATQQTYQQAGSVVAQQTTQQAGSAAQQTYQQVTQTEAPTHAPTEAPVAQTAAPVAATAAPTAAPTPEATTATPVATTAAPKPEVTAAPTPETPMPTETPAITQSSGFGNFNSSAGSDELQFGSASTSGSVSVGSNEPGVSSASTASSSDNKQQSQQLLQTVSSTGTSSQAQQQQGDNVQKANTQSSGGGGATSVAFAVAAAACAVLMAFGFIYKTRQRAAELGVEDKRDNFSVTPIQNTCAL